MWKTTELVESKVKIVVKTCYLKRKVWSFGRITK